VGRLYEEYLSEKAVHQIKRIFEAERIKS